MTDPNSSTSEPSLGRLALFSQAAEAVFVLNRRRQIRYVNRAFEKLIGRSAEHVLGMTCTSRRSAPLLARTLAPTPEARAGALDRVRRPIPPNEGGPPWWDIAFLPLLGEANLHGIIGRIRPIAVTPPEPVGGYSNELRLRLTRRSDQFRYELIGDSTLELQRLKARIRLAAQTVVPVRLAGEAGTGKTTIARIIHHQGILRERPFLRIDCAALPAPALRQMLFGPAGIDHAEPPGTLLLVEPESLPTDVQSKLLDWWTDLEPNTTRVICSTRSTSEDAPGLLDEFQSAFSVLSLRVPPLREQRAEIPRLLTLLADRLRSATGQEVGPISSEALEVLTAYDWPGNIRQLDAVLTSSAERAIGRSIGVEDLPRTVRAAVRALKIAATAPLVAAPRIKLDELLERVERRAIEQALRETKGQKTEAAELLGIWRQRLLRRIKDLGLAVENETASGKGD